MYKNNETAAILVYLPPKKIVWELNSFFSKKFLLFHEVCVATDHMSENDPYQRKNLYKQSFLSFLLRLFIQLCN